MFVVLSIPVVGVEQTLEPIALDFERFVVAAPHATKNAAAVDGNIVFLTFHIIHSGSEAFKGVSEAAEYEGHVRRSARNVVGRVVRVDDEQSLSL